MMYSNYAMMQRLVPLFLLLTASCIVVGAVKRYQPKHDVDAVFEAMKKDTDDLLKLVAQSYAKASVEPSSVECNSDSQCSKSLKSDLNLVLESLERNVGSHVEKLGIASTVPPTASGYTKGEHLESSTTSDYTKEIHSTAADCSKEKSTSVESTTKSSQNGCTTTAAPSISIPPRDSMQVGSISGIPGVNYPDYTDIPITSFTCSDKSYLPGFYADLEADCQVFHVCWPNRRESFLCPLGTTFNQAILACDYWYSTNCSLAPHYYNVNAETSETNQSPQLKNINLSSMINALLEKGVIDSPVASTVSSTSVLATPDAALSFISKFLPVKAKVTIYPETMDKRAKVVVSSSIGHDKKGSVLRSSEKTKLPPKPLHSHSTISAPRPTSPEVPSNDQKRRFEAYDIATKIVLDRFFAELFRLVEKYPNESRMEGGKSPYIADSRNTRKKYLDVIPEDFKEFDLATKRLFDSISEKLERFLQKSSKQADVSNIKEPVNEKHATSPKPPEPVNEKRTSTPKPIESVKVKKSYVLTRLNPRFVVKAVEIPKKKIDQEKSTPHPTKSSPTKPISTVRVVKIRYPQKIVLKSRPYSGKNISPETKKTLIENYLRLLKVKSG